MFSALQRPLDKAILKIHTAEKRNDNLNLRIVHNVVRVRNHVGHLVFLSYLLVGILIQNFGDHNFFVQVLGEPSLV